MAELEEILKMKETVEEGNMREKLPMVQGAGPQQASMPSQQAPIAPSMPLQQPSIAPQEKEKKTLQIGEIVCCGNHVFRVINGERHWISEPPKDWETIDGRVWDS